MAASTAFTKDETTRELISMVDAMLGRGAPIAYDDVGFNKIDYGFGQDISRSFHQRGTLSVRQVRGVQKMLRKYRRQLTSYGFSMDEGAAWAPVEDEPVVAPQEMSATLVGNRIFLDTHGYRPELITKIKQVEGRRYHPAERGTQPCWSIPQESISQAVQQFPENADLKKLATSLKGQVLEVQRYSTVESRALEPMVREKYGTLANGQTLYEHQVVGIAAILSEPSFILADDMGLGKTRQAIVAAVERGGRKLVVCPATPKTNWMEEILMVEPDATINIINGSEGADPDAEWNIINYDILKRNAKSLRADNENPTEVYTTLIGDEAHRVKNSKSQRSVEFVGKAENKKKQVPAYHGLIDFAKHTVLLTGTPIRNRPMDLFQLLIAIRHHLSKNFFKYALRYCNAHNNGFGWDFSGASNLDELGQRIADRFLQRKKDQELPGFPEKVRKYMTVDADLTEYNELADRLDEMVQEGYPVIAQMTKLRVATAKAALPATIELIEDILEGDEKVLVFSNYTEPVDALKAHFGDQAVVIDGRVPNAKRQPIAKQFCTDPKIRVFIGQVQAAGEAINLQAATQVIFNDLDYVPTSHDQCEDRAWRIGQTNHVTSTYIIPGESMALELKALNEGKMQVVGSVEKAVAQEIIRRRKTAKAA